MAKGLSVHHLCDCGHKANISKVVAARRNGTHCPKCGRNMQPSESGWEVLKDAGAAKLGYREPEKVKKVVPKKVVKDVDSVIDDEWAQEMWMEHRMLHGCDD